jgi:hypothetical protein
MNIYIQTVFELSMVLNAEKFQRILNRVKNITEHVGDDVYVDNYMASKGISVQYRDSQYKKRVTITVFVQNDDNHDSDKFIRKLEKYTGDYFNSRYTLNSFSLSGLCLTTDIDVRDHDKVSAYMNVLQRIGKVKGFSPPYENRNNIRPVQ